MKNLGKSQQISRKISQNRGISEISGNLRKFWKPGKSRKIFENLGIPENLGKSRKTLEISEDLEKSRKISKIFENLGILQNLGKFGKSQKNLGHFSKSREISENLKTEIAENPENLGKPRQS